jgi:succinyl-CoA synthetase alpha subunit
MIVKGFIKRGAYHDSVTLMLVSKEINQTPGVLDSGVVMATVQNIALLSEAGLFLPEYEGCSDSDLIVSVKSETPDAADMAIANTESRLKGIKDAPGQSGKPVFRSLSAAVSSVSGVNLALISVAGRYAAAEALRALESGLNVMLFSDNVSIEDEISLKTLAKEKGLLMMGPDCGTSIINGVPLAFANVVNRGNIGLVAASGTGLQEVSSIISNLGGGISQAIGTGGRDVKKQVGGIMFIEAMKALANDSETHCLVLISKPPDAEVLQAISKEISVIEKPVVAILIGGNPDTLRKSGAIPATTLEEAAQIAVSLINGQSPNNAIESLESRNHQITARAKLLATTTGGKYIRGLFSGGTLCDEAQLVMKDTLGFVYSNTPLSEKYMLVNANQSREHTLVDLGDDEFTRGKPHPMIDFSLRVQRIHKETADPEVAVILFDLVLGYGSHPDPLSELLPAIEKALFINPSLIFICAVCGTDGDPQGRQRVSEKLAGAGVEVMPSNAAASLLASQVIVSLYAHQR